MHILVTGATGGLGRNAVEGLLRRGVAVRATGRNASVGEKLKKGGAEFVQMDLVDAAPSQLAELVAGIDAVWHCAALSSPWGRREDFIACNVTATQRLLEAAGASGVPRFVHISTPALYFDYKDRFNIPETFKPQKYVNDYAYTKALAETCVQEAVVRFPKMVTTVLRPRAIFGPYDQVLIPRLRRVLSQRSGRLPLPRGGTAVFDMTYADNVVHAMSLATHRGNLQSGGVFNITNGEPRDIASVLTQLFIDELREGLTIVDTPYILLMGAARIEGIFAAMTGKEPQLTKYSIGALAHHMTLSIEEARAKLGYEPVVNIDEGIRRTAAWLKAHG